MISFNVFVNYKVMLDHTITMTLSSLHRSNLLLMFRVLLMYLSVPLDLSTILINLSRYTYSASSLFFGLICISFPNFVVLIHSAYFPLASDYAIFTSFVTLLSAPWTRTIEVAPLLFP